LSHPTQQVGQDLTQLIRDTFPEYFEYTIQNTSEKISDEAQTKLDMLWAASMANIRYDSRGSPVINSATDYLAYQAAMGGLTDVAGNSDKNNYSDRLSDIDPKLFYCQTGGWYTENNGSDQCARTSAATMASINSGSIVLPTDVSFDLLSITLKGTTYARTNIKMNGTTDFTGSEYGYHCYYFSSEEQLMEAINVELSNGRSVEVHTAHKENSEHWVTVTETIGNKTAENFNDLMGIDPWYNGLNTFMDKSSPILSAQAKEKSGVVVLSGTLTNQRINSDYRMFTFNID
jgi:hypothetical protein